MRRSTADDLRILEQLLAASEAERNKKLREWRRRDPEFAAQLEELLERDAEEERSDGLRRVVGREASGALKESRSAWPNRIGPYTVHGALGQGSHGVVLKAREDGTGLEVALKLLNTPFSTEVLRRRFQREAEILSLLDHPAIARVHESGHARVGGMDQPYIAMELVAGEPITSFAHKLKAQSEVLSLFTELCHAVHYAHEAGVIHRDLKPANILVGKDGAVKVLDFGIAWIDDRDGQSLLTRSGEGIGTPSYMSPEQVRGERGRIDPRTDVYGLGAILCELLTGVPPLGPPCGEVTEALRRVLDEQPRRPSARNASVSRELDWICLRALEKDPVNRYASAEALADDVERILAGQAPIAGRPPLRRTLARFGHAHPVQSTIAVTLALSGLSAIGFGLARVQELRSEVQAAERSWTRGELIGALESANTLPAWSQRWFGHNEFPRLANLEETARPVQHVLELARERGRDAARWRAATYLERDGCDAHRTLAAFLANELRTMEPDACVFTLAPVARMFFDRPDVASDDLDASIEIRETLQALDWSALGQDARFHVLVALGGCGDGTSAERLLTWLRSEFPPASKDEWELLRIGFRAARDIVLRLHRTGRDRGAAFDATAWETFAFSTLKLTKPEHRLPRSSIGDFVASIAILQTARGLPVSHETRWLAPHARFMVAGARRDREAFDRLFEELSGELFLRWDPAGIQELQSVMLGLMFLNGGEPDPERTARLRGLALEQGAGDARFERCWSGAGTAYVSRSQGLRPDDVPDLDTHLGHGFGEALATPKVPPLQRVADADPSRVLARWTFTHAEVLSAGRSASVFWMGVLQLQDELDPTRFHARLGPTENSRIICKFRGVALGETLSGGLSLRILAGKALRGSLPELGQAELLVHLDGHLVGRVAVLDTSMGRPIRIPMPWIDAEPHELVLRLHESSNTTVRVDEISLEKL